MANFATMCGVDVVDLLEQRRQIRKRNAYSWLKSFHDGDTVATPGKSVWLLS